MRLWKIAVGKKGAVKPAGSVFSIPLATEKVVAVWVRSMNLSLCKEVVWRAAEFVYSAEENANLRVLAFGLRATLLGLEKRMTDCRQQHGGVAASLFTRPRRRYPVCKKHKRLRPGIVRLLLLLQFVQ